MSTDALAAANALINDGKYDEAEKICRREIVLHPSDALFYTVYGNCFFSKKEYALAEKQYRTALTFDPDETTTLANLAGVCYELGRYAECLRVCGRILTADPDNVLALIHKGNALSASERWEEALDAYNRAEQIVPDDALVSYNKATALIRLEKFKEAVDICKKLSARFPDNADYLSVFATALEGMEDFFEAGRKNLSLLKKNPQIYGHIALGGDIYALYVREKETEAMTLLDDWLQAFPDNPVALHALQTFSGEDGDKRATPDYVRELFDAFADSFDDVLANLDYQAPRLIAEKVLSTTKKSGAVLDLGCGTGLCGAALANGDFETTSLTGVDLSEKMIAKAEKRGIYTQLTVADIMTYLPRHKQTFDLIVSGDVFTYLGDLSLLFKGIAAALKTNGRAVFTLSRSEEDDDGYQLTPSGRYVHGKQYLTRVLNEAGLSADDICNVVLRYEMGNPVAGFLVDCHAFSKRI